MMRLIKPEQKFQRACNFQLQGSVTKTLNNKYHARMEGVKLTLAHALLSRLWRECGGSEHRL